MREAGSKLLYGDVTDGRYMRGRGLERVVPREGLQVAAVPRLPEQGADGVARSLHDLEQARQLGLERHEPLVGDPGVDDLFFAVLVGLGHAISNLVDEPLT